MRPEPIVVTLTTADALANRIADAVQGRVHARGQDFTDTSAHLRNLFVGGHPVIGLCAAGILIRSLAPILASKADKPPVVAVAEDGSAVVPLLGGHRGANDLARRIAEALGTVSSITTAGDLALGVALDAPPPGWRLENPEDAKAVMAALLRGAAANLSGDPTGLRHSAPPRRNRLPSSAGQRCARRPAGRDRPRRCRRRQGLALGVGCVRGCDPGDLIGLVHRSLADAGRSAFEVAGIWSVDLKADEAAVHALAAALGVSVRFFPPERLEAETPRLHRPVGDRFRRDRLPRCRRSRRTRRRRTGWPPGARKAEIRDRHLRACRPRLGAGTGSPARRLAVVGIGPGTPEWRTPKPRA